MVKTDSHLQFGLQPAYVISLLLAPAVLYKLWYLHHIDWIWYVIIYTLSCLILILRKTSCSLLLINALLSILIAPTYLAWWVVIWVPWFSGIFRHVLGKTSINALMVAWALVFTVIEPNMLIMSSATILQIDWQAKTWVEFASAHMLIFNSSFHLLMLAGLILIAGLASHKIHRSHTYISVSFFCTFILLHLCLFLQFSDNQHQVGPPWFYLFNSGALLAGWFVLTDPKSAPLSKPSQIASGIIAAALLVYCHHTLPTPDSIVATVLSTNLIIWVCSAKIDQIWAKIHHLIHSKNNAIQ